MEDMPTLRRSDGFTLVELMMATAITLIVLATATGTFRNALLLNDTATMVSDSNQNLRSGTHVFVRDLMQAGRGITIGGIPIPSGTGATALVRPGPTLTPAVVLNFNNTTQTTLNAITTGYRQGPLIAGRTNASDIVTMLALDPTSYVAYPAGSFQQMPLYAPNPNPVPTLPTGVTAPAPTILNDGSSLTVGQFSTWISDPVSGIKAGDILLFTNTNGTAIQTVTSVSATAVFFAANDPFRFNQRGAANGSILQLRGGAAAFPQTDVVRIQMLTYYLELDTATPPVPRLMRRLNHLLPAQALAGELDDLTITYDMVDDPLSPVYPVDLPSLPVTFAGKIFGASQIRKANLRMAVRSETKSSVQNDYLRNTVNTVVSLRSLAYIDRYQ
jgi:prepilin-type N-terminal cleavage/methylation domain-containing protein